MHLFFYLFFSPIYFYKKYFFNSVKISQSLNFKFSNFEKFLKKRIYATPKAVYTKNQSKGRIDKTGSSKRSIPFSNPAAAARARPACHKCPTKKKKPKTK